MVVGVQVTKPEGVRTLAATYHIYSFDVAELYLNLMDEHVYIT